MSAERAFQSACAADERRFSTWCLQSTSLRTESWIRNEHVSLDTGVETGPLVKGRERKKEGRVRSEKGAMLLLG